MINSIKLPETILDQYKVIDKPNNKLIKHLEKVNIFVGPNNSGKSRLIRSLFLQSTLESFSKNDDYRKYSDSQIDSVCTMFKKDIEKVFARYHVDPQKADEYLFNSNTINTELKVDEKRHNFVNIISNIRKNMTTAHSIMDENKEITQGEWPEFESAIINIMKHYSQVIHPNKRSLDLILTVDSETTKYYPVTKIYIPALRGLRTFNEKDNEEIDIYKNRTSLDYFIPPSNENLNWNVRDYIFTGLNLYEEIKTHLLGSLKKRELIRKFESFIGESFFEGQEIVIIPSVENRALTIKIGKEKEQPIYNLGDGIQSIIIMTFPLFIYPDQHLLLFIEEPELFLHPGMQRVLLETFLHPRFHKVQYFIATHSNHLLDMSIDFKEISIFSCRKNKDTQITSNEIVPEFNIKNESRTEGNLLELLGVRNSSVFLSNCTIWIEGVTDRLYIRHFLKLYQEQKGNERKFKEDLHYSFVEYSGNNITHFSFLDEEEGIDVESLCGTLFLITDKDEGNEERFEKLKEILGDRFYCLSVREIENILSREVLLKVIAEYEKIEVDNLKLKDFKEDDYRNKPLGNFIESLFIEDKNRKASYAGESGTINRKDDFCKKAIAAHTDEYDDLSDDAKKLIEKIYIFIKENNK